MVWGDGSGGEKWRRLKGRTLLTGPVFTVTEVVSEGPEGRVGTFSVLEARDWATVVPVIGGGKDLSFLMVRQYRHGMEEVCVEFPGGVVEAGEAPMAAAVRELEEETGYRAGRMVHAGTVSPNPAIMANRYHVYVAFDLTASGKLSLDEHEIVDAYEVPADEVFAKMGEPPYSHALMACALLLAQRVLGR